MKVKRKSWRPAIPLLALAWLTVGGVAAARDSVTLEYQVKAAFLFNFAKFVQWPPTAFAGVTSPIIIGILGESPFHDDLARTIRNKTVDDHPLLIKELHSPKDATNCHIL